VNNGMKSRSSSILDGVGRAVRGTEMTLVVDVTGMVRILGLNRAGRTIVATALQYRPLHTPTSENTLPL